MKLNPHKKRVVFKFYDFNQVFLRVCSGDGQPQTFKFFPKIIIEFIAMAMAFHYVFFAVSPGAYGARFYLARIRSEAHCSAVFISSSSAFNHMMFGLRFASHAACLTASITEMYESLKVNRPVEKYLPTM